MDPQTTIDSVKLAGSVAANDLSVMGLFSHADLLGKIVITGLVVISILTWAIIFDKATKISRLKSRAAHFEERFWSSGSDSWCAPWARCSSATSATARVGRPHSP